MTVEIVYAIQKLLITLDGSRERAHKIEGCTLLRFCRASRFWALSLVTLANPLALDAHRTLRASYSTPYVQVGASFVLELLFTTDNSSSADVSRNTLATFIFTSDGIDTVATAKLNYTRWEIVDLGQRHYTARGQFYSRFTSGKTYFVPYPRESTY